MVVETLDRAALVAVQTPQAFAALLLRRAHTVQPELDASDDCLLVERLGEPVAVVLGEIGNRKITHPEDLVWLRGELQGSGNR
jgi:2-C-methyl-D-erythritol 4-phosphate cytidylyltransferase